MLLNREQLQNRIDNNRRLLFKARQDSMEATRAGEWFKVAQLTVQASRLNQDIENDERELLYLG